MKLLLMNLLLLSTCTYNQNKTKKTEQLKHKLSVDTSLQKNTVKLCSGYNVLDLDVFKDSAKGRHCFVFGDGERVDCCDDNKNNTLFLKKVNDKKWVGSLKSCYNSESIDVELLKLTKNKYKLLLKNYDLAQYIDFTLCKHSTESL